MESITDDVEELPIRFEIAIRKIPGDLDMTEEQLQANQEFINDVGDIIMITIENMMDE
jgi:hypothetical protein